MYAIETGDRLFHDGNGTTELGTILPAWWLNQVQAEILAVLQSAEIDPNKADTGQLKAAIKAMIDGGLDGAVKTEGNQNINGDKTFTGLATLKKGAIVADTVGDFAANQWLQIGSNNVNSYFYNKRSGKYLSMRNDGELRYDGKRILNADDLLGMVPSGTVLYFAGSAAPAGWLKANGAALSRTAYAALFAAIGTTYGAGDGRSTFNLPDLRGEFLRGWDDGRGIDTGRVFGSAQADEFRAHNHVTNINADIPTYGSETGDSVGTEDVSRADDRTVRATTGMRGGAETRPRNIALLACIKI